MSPQDPKAIELRIPVDSDEELDALEQALLRPPDQRMGHRQLEQRPGRMRVNALRPPLGSPSCASRAGRPRVPRSMNLVRVSIAQPNSSLDAERVNYR